MISIKKKLKKIMPQRIIYLNDIRKIFPKYLRAKKISKKYQGPTVKFYDDDKTIDMIVNGKKSMARFGDGEFMWMSGERIDSFQEYSENFSNDLKKAFSNQNPNLLIGIPYGIFDSSKCNVYAKMHWAIIRNNFLKRLEKFIDINKIYCNASITRPYIDYKSRSYSARCFKNIKKIWENKNIVIVEGEKTKLGIGNDLFSNAKRIKRIICPAVNAYEKIEEIKNSVRKNVSKKEMILCALGPTASILASDMCNEGYQIIDIGHIDIEYMWYIKKAIVRIPIDGKYVNESGEKNCTNSYDNDYEYINSIIDKIV